MTLILSANFRSRSILWDNAPMESFFDTLKTEHVYHECYRNVAHAREKIFEWIEVFYNRQRIHSSLGYVSPACFQGRYVAKAAKITCPFYEGKLICAISTLYDKFHGSTDR